MRINIFSDLFFDFITNHETQKCDVFNHAWGYSLCKPGFVYIVKFGDLYKIGSTNGARGISSIRYRILAANRQVGQVGAPICYIETNCSLGFEYWLHEEYKHKRVKTEYFALSDYDLRKIKSMTQFNDGTLTLHSLEVSS